MGIEHCAVGSCSHRRLRNANERQEWTHCINICICELNRIDIFHFSSLTIHSGDRLKNEDPVAAADVAFEIEANADSLLLYAYDFFFRACFLKRIDTNWSFKRLMWMGIGTGRMQHMQINKYFVLFREMVLSINVCERLRSVSYEHIQVVRNRKNRNKQIQRYRHFN